jgi:hypothetical protein
LRHSDLPFVWNAPVLPRQRTAVSAAVLWSQKQNLEKPPVRWVSGEGANMKKQLPTHNDEPSIKPAPKVLNVEEPNYEGDVKQGKYSVEDYEAKEHTNTLPQSKSGDPYPFPHDDIDLYAVDTRIWDRIGEMGGGEGGAPHTHDNYATKTELSNGLAGKSDDPHTHSEYAGKTHTHSEYADKTHTHPPQDLTHNHDGEYADAQTLADHLLNHPSGGDGGSYDDTAVRALIQTNTDDIAGLEAENNSQNQNIQANTDALADKADANHTHPAPTGFWGMWSGTQAEYDALGTYDNNTLYVVV